ncbi:MAG: histidine phosphatase family protein [Phycisphaerae bacterium]|nr:histidine phosphatase family protein [Phycisphaerae bacterium]
MSATRFLLIRHGETQWNRQGRRQGHGDSPLTPTGIAQARALAFRLAETNFKALYTSDLGRAVETARHIADRTGHEVQIDTRLRERAYGIFEGLTIRQAQTLHADIYKQYRDSGPDYVIPGGESTRQRLDLFLTCLRHLADRHRDQQVAVVAHGGTINLIYRVCHGLPLRGPRHFDLPNAGINVIDFTNGRWHVVHWADVSHLSEMDAIDR